jgi:hypothetical protein
MDRTPTTTTTPEPLDDLGLGAVALLRTAGWIYGLLVVAAAATAPLDVRPSLAAGLIVPLTPLVLTAVAWQLLAARGRALRVVPFALAASAGTVVALAAHVTGDAITDAALAAAGIAATGVAFAVLGPPAEACGTTRRWPHETEGRPNPTPPDPPTPGSGAQTHDVRSHSSVPTGSGSARSSASSPSPPGSTSSPRSSSRPSSTRPSRSATTSF